MRNLSLRVAGLAIFLVSTAGLRAQTLVFTKLWSIGSGAGRAYVTAGNTERGVAYNPVNNHVYIVSRAVGTKVAIVDGDTGAEVGFLNVTGITGGTFALSTISVSDDGAIYAANLTTALATSSYRIYRWATEASAPTVVYSANPVGASATRMGDAPIDVRGSGLNTEIISAPQNVAVAVIFKPNDASLGTFTSTRIDVSGIGSQDMNKGISWGPTNTFYGKNSGNTTVRFCSYDAGAGTGALLATYNTGADQPATVDVDPVRNILAGADCGDNTTAHSLRIWDLSSGTTPSSLFTTPFATPFTTNGNAVGQVQISGDRIVAIDTQNGVVMVKITVNNNAVPPTITQQPVTNVVVGGGYVTLTMGANGTKPLFYQWLYEGAPIPGANTNFLVLTNITLSQTGRYSAVVTNEAGSTNTIQALITVTPSVRSTTLTKAWQLAPGTRPWLTTDNNQRGLAFNPQSGHVLIVSRSPATAVYIVDAADGAELGTLNTTGITGGTFDLNLIGVTDDGTIYAANLTTGSGTTPLKVYRWAFEDTSLPPTVAYSGDPANGAGGTSVRWGDNMDVRGAGNSIQLLLASRNGNKAAILTSADAGINFLATTITTDAPEGSMGLGVAFGAGDTFWAKATALALRQISFSLFSGSGATLHTYGSSTFPSAVGPISVDVNNNYLAAVSLETPDNLRLYNLADLADGPLWLDTEFFALDNANANGTGAADFGSGLLFALDSNNGLTAFIVQNPPIITCAANKTVECGTGWTFDEPTANDPCDGTSVPVVVASTTTNTLCGNTFSATRIWEARSSCGPKAQCSQTVTVTDTTVPTITCAQDKAVECGLIWSFDPPVASDSCGTATNLVISTLTNAFPGGNYSVTRTWQAVDACGNTSVTCGQTVTVMDTTPPSITCPSDITTSCTGTGGATATFFATASDTCTGTPTLTCAPPSGSTFARGTNSVNCQATDAAGNHNSCTFKVIVVDGSPAPAMTIARDGNVITISWPDTCTQYTLQETTTLSPPAWSTAMGTVVAHNSSRVIVTLSNDSENKFFRLTNAP